MRTKNQETLDRILKFVNKYYQEYHSSPTINDVAEGVGVARSTTHRYLQELRVASRFMRKIVCRLRLNEVSRQ